MIRCEVHYEFVGTFCEINGKKTNGHIDTVGLRVSPVHIDSNPLSNPTQDGTSILVVLFHFHWKMQSDVWGSVSDQEVVTHMTGGNFT
uniref:Uncharacterized protein n=1 Tax=Solanum lycopersicum TaxID=4081 RepID=A0A3Q7JBS4_SOLLC